MPLDAMPLSKIIADGVDTGTLEMDTRGYVRFKPTESELKEIESYLGEEIARTLIDYDPLFQEAVENVKTYRHVKVTIKESGKSILPAPIARIPADQIIASTFNTVMKSRPVFSFDPYFAGDFDVPVPPPAIPGAPPLPPVIVKKNAEDISAGLERGMEFKIRERLGFEGKLNKAIRGAVVGCPYWWKVCADPKSRDLMAPKVSGAFLYEDDKVSYRSDGEIVQLYLVPYFNFVKPVDVADDELDEGPWCAERVPCEPDEIVQKYVSKEYFLIENQEDAEKIAKITADVQSPFQQAIAAMTQQKSPMKPRQVCNRWLVWFYRVARYKDPETGAKSIKRLNLIGNYHLGAKRLLDCHLNPNEHQSRPYVMADQMEEGDSTVKILRWHQDVATHLMQAQIKNAFIANNMNTWSAPDTDAADWFAKHPVIAPGDHIEAGKKDEDWGVTSLGTEHESLLPTWTAVVSEARAASKVSSMQSGETLPGRTPSSTMQQVLEQGAQSDILFLRRLSTQLSRVVRLYIETARQFQPMGETIPIFDPVKKQILEIPFRFPVGEMLDNFRIALTASDQALARERSMDQIATWKNILMQDSEFVAKVAAALVDQRTTPALAALLTKSLERNERLVTKIIQLSDTDEEYFDLTKEIDALVKEQEQMRAMMQQQAAQQTTMQQQGMTNAGNQAAPPQGNVPRPNGPSNGVGPSGAGAQPGVPVGALPAPAGNVPSAQQIQ